jgi:hypothetical protein
MEAEKKMTRTWTLVIALAVLMGSVCMGQDSYLTMAPAGLNIAGLNPLSMGNAGSLTMAPSTSISDEASLTATLTGVQNNLAIFEGCSIETGLPMNMCPFWGNLPDFGQSQSGMGLQQPGQTITTGNVTGMMPASFGLSNMSALSIGSFDTLQITGINGLLGNP